MRIAYVVPWSGRLDAGVMKNKVDVQVDRWRRAGHVVRTFVLRRAGEPTEPMGTDEGRHIVTYSGVWTRFIAVHQILAAVGAWQPSLVYARYDLWWPSLPRVARRVPVVMEVNTDDVLEQRLGRPLPQRAFNRLTRRSVLSTCSGLVFVTEELARSDRFRRSSCISTVIANSFDLEGTCPSPPPPKRGTRIAFLGTGEAWQGVDHVVCLARLFPDWEFDLAGVDASDTPSAPPNVRCHGFLSKREYEPILRQANAAIGSLALYRKGLHEASPLKVRDYLAHGIPTIIGYRDTDFPNGAPFLLQIPNEPGAVERSAALIRDFVVEWHDRRVDRSSIQHIDVAVKEAERLTFFSDVMSAHENTDARLSGRRSRGRGE